MLFYALTAPGHTVDQVALVEKIERLKKVPVSVQELERVNTGTGRIVAIAQIKYGDGSMLLEYEVKTGSWHNLFKELEAIAAVTPADIQQVVLRERLKITVGVCCRKG